MATDRSDVDETNHPNPRCPGVSIPHGQTQFQFPDLNAFSLPANMGPLTPMFGDGVVPVPSFLSQPQSAQPVPVPGMNWMGGQPSHPARLSPSAFAGFLQHPLRLPQSNNPVLIAGLPPISSPTRPQEVEKLSGKSMAASNLSLLFVDDEEDDVKQPSTNTSPRIESTNQAHVFPSKNTSSYIIPEARRERGSALQRNAFTAHVNSMHRSHGQQSLAMQMDVDADEGDVEMKLNNPTVASPKRRGSVDSSSASDRAAVVMSPTRSSTISGSVASSGGSRTRKRQRDGDSDGAVLAAKRKHSETSDSVVNARAGSAASLNRANGVKSVVPRIPRGGLAQFVELDAVSENPEVLERLREAKMLNERGKLEEALELYEEVLENYEEFNIEALNGKGCIYGSFNKTVQAAACFEKITKHHPANWSACHNRASLFEDAGLHRQAIQWYTDAHNAAMNQRNQLLVGVQKTKQHRNEVDASNPEEMDKLRRQQQVYEGELSQMESNLKMIRVHMAMSMTDLGTRMKFSGDINEACHCYEVALQWAQDYAPAYYNLGVAAGELGFFADALQYYTAALERKPDYVEALCNVGVIFKNAGNIEGAIECYLRALKHSNCGQSPAKCNTLLNNNLAVAFTDLGTKMKDTDMDDAIRCYRKALLHNPKSADAWYNLGVAYSEQGEFEESLLSYKMCLMMNPSCEHAFNNMGVILKDFNRLSEAVDNYEAALKINPKFCHALNNLSVLHTMVGSIENGFKFANLAIESNPDYSEAHNNLGVLYRHESKIMDAIRSYERCLELDPFSNNASQNRLLAMNYTGDYGVDVVSREHFKWGRDFFYKTYSVVPYTDWPSIAPVFNENRQTRRLVIGFISPDFFNHSVSYFIHSYLKHIDRTRTHVILYSNVVCQDDKTELFKQMVEDFVDVRHMGGAEKIAQRIRDQDHVDILVELAGHTANNCLHVMAYKPAPICVSWIGYPNTTGLPTIDYRFTDSTVDPVSKCCRFDVHDDVDLDEKEREEDRPQSLKQMYSEELIRIPHCFLCYSPMNDLPPVQPLPCLRNGFVTFGSFNNSAKVTDEVVELWCECMKAAGASSRFVMKCKPLADESVRKAFFGKFERFGIQSKYVDLLPIVADTREHLNMYNMMDVALDTFPYAGTTTTCEAMVMGVPTVTLGQATTHNHAHNVGVTLNSQIGALLEDGFVAWTKADYVAGATAWCHSPAALNRANNLRCSLRQKMLASPLCNSVKHAANVNDAFFRIFDKFMSAQS